MRDTQKAQVVRLMRKMISGQVENKEVSWRVDDNLHNSPITANDCYSIIKNIPEGNTSYQRDGDRIKPKFLMVSGDVSVNPGYNPDTRVMYVRVIVASQKNTKQSAAGVVAGIDTDHLLRSGDATIGAETNFDGTLTKLRYRVNDNKFRVYFDKVFRLCPTSAASGFPLTDNQFSFQIGTTKLPANLSFDEGAGDYPNNFAPFLAIGYCYADGGVPDTLNSRIITKVSSKLIYEDA